MQSDCVTKPNTNVPLKEFVGFECAEGALEVVKELSKEELEEFEDDLNFYAFTGIQRGVVRKLASYL